MYCVRPYFEIAYCVPFQNKTNNAFVVSISMTKIKNTVCDMQMHRPIVRFQQFMLYSLLQQNIKTNMRVQSERAHLVSYLRVFVKFVVFLVENFIFNVSFEVCIRTNRTLRNRYLQTAYSLTSLPLPLLYGIVALYMKFMNRPKLPTVITSLDSTFYHCHQQCFSSKYWRIVFLNYILFWTYLLKI